MLNFDFNNDKESTNEIANVNNNANFNVNANMNISDLKKSNLNQENKMNKQSLMTNENQSLNNSKSLSQIHKIKNMKTHFSSVNMNSTNIQNNIVTEIINKNIGPSNLVSSGIYKGNNSTYSNNLNVNDNNFKLPSKYKIK